MEEMKLQRAQMWLARRLLDQELDDFERRGILMYSTMALVPPPILAHVWRNFQSTGGDPIQISEEEAARVNVSHSILIFSNPYEAVQLETMCALIVCIDALGEGAPPILWVPHTVAPEERPDEHNLDVMRDDFVENTLALGLDGVLSGEPEGFLLSLAVRAKIRKSAMLSRTMNEIVTDRTHQRQHAQYLRDCIQDILWNHLRLRLFNVIPQIDINIPAGEVQQVGNYRFSRLLGRGQYGRVYLINLMPDDVPTDEVMKVVDKSGITGVHDLKCLRRMIDVMFLLSSEQWRHRSIVNLYEVHHSSTHLFFRMEYGGPENLYRRLVYRRREDIARHRPLPLSKVRQLIVQAGRVVAYLHTGPSVAHRDIKPENFIITETADEIVLRLADLDLAMVCDSEVRTYDSCGTMPFMAPEVILEREYNVFATDMWSLGLVLFEVLCGVRVVERALDLRLEDERQNIARRIQLGMADAATVRAMLEDLCLEEVRPLLPQVREMIGGLLAIAPALRWTAAALEDVCGPLEVATT